MRTTLSLLAMLHVSRGLCATVQLYSNGNLVDPSANTDLTYAWVGGSDLSGAYNLGSGFMLPSESLLDSVNILTYDTTDGSVGYLQQVGYAIYSGNSGPVGPPIASGNGTILSSALLAGHSCPASIGSDGKFHDALDTIATSFQLASPLDLKGDTKYWLVLAGLTDPLGSSDIAQWADSDLVGGSYLVGGQQISGGRAFQLDGEPVGIPESPWLLVLGPFLGLAAVYRRFAKPTRPICAGIR